MPTLVTCACGKQLQVKDELIGKPFRCPACKNVFPAVPPSATEAESLPAAIPLGPPAPNSVEPVASWSTGPDTAARFYIVAGTERRGPFSLAQMANEAISVETMVWKSGMPDWAKVGQVPELQELLRRLSASPPPLPDAIPVLQVAPSSGSSRSSSPWNPITVAWLGLLFSPVWAGIMAAINTRRLKTNGHVARPIAIGVGSLILDLIINLWVDIYLLDLLLYTGAVGLIAFFDLLPQRQAYQQHIAREPVSGRWLVPSLAGSPLALLVLFSFGIYPLIPLEPRQVCEKFVQASSESELRKYTTANLGPALKELAKSTDQNSQSKMTFELTDEAPAPEGVGGYAVGFRMMQMQKGEASAGEGLFHLVHWDGQWKIEELYLTALNRQPLEPWFALSRDYSQLAQPASANSSVAQQQHWYNDPKTSQVVRGTGMIARANWSKIAKSCGAVMVAIIAGFAFIGKVLSWIFHRGSSEKQSSV